MSCTLSPTSKKRKMELIDEKELFEAQLEQYSEELAHCECMHGYVGHDEGALCECMHHAAHWLVEKEGVKICNCASPALNDAQSAKNSKSSPKIALKSENDEKAEQTWKGCWIFGN